MCLNTLKNAHNMHIGCFVVFIIFRNGISFLGAGSQDFSRQLGEGSFDLSQEFRGEVLLFFPKSLGGSYNIFPGENLNFVPLWAHFHCTVPKYLTPDNELNWLFVFIQ